MPITPLPIGVDDFEKIIQNGYYYVDKTLLIKELLDKSGNGRYDICIYSRDIRKPVILIELKLAARYRELSAACGRAMEQLRSRGYASEWAEDGYSEAICYGIGFYKKTSCVMAERIKL